jgi:hypothetical protein
VPVRRAARRAGQRSSGPPLRELPRRDAGPLGGRADARLGAYVVGDAADRGVALGQKLEGTVVSCGHCGAPLALQGRQRNCVCAHCRSENFLSDAIWTKLFPQPEAHVFYLVYELDDAAQADALAFLVTTGHYFFDEAEKSLLREKVEAVKDLVLAARVRRALESQEDKIDEDVARQIFARNDLDAETVANVDKRLSHKVREVAATGAASAAFVAHWLASNDEDIRAVGARFASGDALRACATDASREVRAVIASRADTPPELLAALRKDPHDAVRQKARANASYQPGFFTRLFGG